MLLSLLTACTSADTADTQVDDTSSDSSTDSEDTGTPVDIVWTKYKIDTTASLRGVYSSGAGVYVVGTLGRAWVGSATEAWTALTLPEEVAGADLNAIWGSGSEDLLQMVVAGDDGWVLTYESGAWAATAVGVGVQRAVGASSLNNVYVVGDDGILHFDGTDWTVELVTSGPLNAVWAGPEGVWAAGDEGAVYHRDAEGNWTSVSTGRTANWYGVGGTSDTDVWVVGDQAVTMHYDGAAWTQAETPLDDTLNAIFVADDGSAVTVGNTGAAMKWGGTAWAEQGSDTHQNLYAAHGVSGTNVWAVGNGGLAMQYKAE